jgi:3-(3-hydroxy-phenyl)propionate hydroxylase
MVFPHEMQEEMEKPDKVWELIEPWAGPDDVELDRVLVYTFHSILAQPWRDRRLFIAGDAAHQMPPHIGQGQCSAVRDSRNLAWKLAMVLQGRAGDDLLDTYESERIPNVLEFIRVATQHSQVASGILLAERPLANVQGSETRWATELTSEVTPARETTEMQGFPQPPLGPGVHGDTCLPIGTLFPQPRLSDGRRLDDVSGERFTILGDPEVIGAASDQTRRIWDSVQAAIIADRSETVDMALETLDTRVVILRPDRYILGLASGPAELDAVTTLIPQPVPE